MYPYEVSKSSEQVLKVGQATHSIRTMWAVNTYLRCSDEDIWIYPLFLQNGLDFF